MKKVLLFIAASFTMYAANAQSLNVTLMANTYQQSFDSTLSNADDDTVAAPLPFAWQITEHGADFTDYLYFTNSNVTAPGIFSLGDASDPDLLPTFLDPNDANNSDRAMGAKADKNYLPVVRFGIKVTNGESDTAITSMQVSFKGETWYQPNGSTQIDTLRMYFSTTADSVGDTTATWTEIPQLAYPLKDSLDLDQAFQYNYAGNFPGNFKILSGNVTGFNVLPGKNLYIMWQPTFTIGNQTNVGGIDDLDITFGFGAQVIEEPIDTPNIVITPQRNSLEASLYPTTATEDVKVKISSSLKAVDWYITNTTGQRVKTGTIAAPGYSESTTTVDVRDLAAGIYLMHLNAGDEKVRTLRFIRQ